jgi:hypothetical protein
MMIAGIKIRSVFIITHFPHQSRCLMATIPDMDSGNRDAAGTATRGSAHFPANGLLPCQTVFVKKTLRVQS